MWFKFCLTTHVPCPKFSIFCFIAKTLASLWLIVVFQSQSSIALAETIQPDEFGYYAISNLELAGPAADFFDISGRPTATRLIFTDVPDFSEEPDSLPKNVDDGLAAFESLGLFQNGFPFYGTAYSSLHVSTNGYLTFGSPAEAIEHTPACPLNDAKSPNSIIAVLWDDLVMGNPPDDQSGGYKENFENCPIGGATRRCIIFQWEKARHFIAASASPGSDMFSFQVVLYEDGGILMNYGAGNPDGGSGSSTGLESPAGQIGTTAACHEAGTIGGATGISSILFSNAAPEAYAFVTVSTQANVCGSDKSVTVAEGDSVTVCYTFGNMGYIPFFPVEMQEINGIIHPLSNAPLKPGEELRILRTFVPETGESLSAEWFFHSVLNQVTLPPIASDTASVFVNQDDDADGVVSINDNCPFVANADQADRDADNTGDACDNCPQTTGISTPDRCGICGGDGTLCLECLMPQPLDALVTNLKGLLKQQKKLVLKQARRLLERTGRYRRFVRKTRAANKELYQISLAVLDQKLPPILQICENTVFCTKSNEPAEQLKVIVNSSNSMDGLLTQTVNRLKRNNALKIRAGNKITAQSAQLSNQILTLTSTVPAEVSQCS